MDKDSFHIKGGSFIMGYKWESSIWVILCVCANMRYGWWLAHMWKADWWRWNKNNWIFQRFQSNLVYYFVYFLPTFGLSLCSLRNHSNLFIYNLGYLFNIIQFNNGQINWNTNRQLQCNDLVSSIQLQLRMKNNSCGKAHIPTSSIQMGMNIIWDYGKGIHGSIGRKFPCHKKRGIFLHMTLRHENKFDVFARGKKRKKPFSVQKLVYIFYMLVEKMNN